MTTWQRHALDALSVLMESIPWFVGITVLATVGERGFLDQVAEGLSFRIGAGEFADPVRAQQVADQLARDAAGATAGPPWILMLLAGLGGFWLMRGLVQARIGGAIGAIALVLASVLGLNLLLHATFAHDLFIWQNDGLASFIDDPQAYVASGADYQAIVDRGGIIIGSGTAIAVTFAGMVGIWLRFLYVARRQINFDHVLRSFTIGFAIILVSLVLARANDIGQLAIWVLPYFVLGLLALAVANGERAALPDEGRERAASWGISVTATLGLLVVVSSVFGVLALLDVAAVLGTLGGWIGVIVEWVLLIILTPIFWVLVPIMDFIIPDGLAERLQEIQPPSNLVPPEDAAANQQDDFLFPRWPIDVAKVLIFVGLVWLSYRVGRALLARREAGTSDEFDEFRADSTTRGAGLGGLLRGLLRRARPQTTRWLALRPIYGLYGRSVRDAEQRGFERRLSETPLEYSAASGTVLDAPVFRDIAAAFDAARYGDHDATPEDVQRWTGELDAWERSHPESEEQRERLEQIRPPRNPRPVDPAEEFAQRVRRGREAARRMRSGQGLNPQNPTQL